MFFIGDVQGFSLLHHSKVFSGYYKNYGEKAEQNVTIRQSTSHALGGWDGGWHDWNRRSQHLIFVSWRILFRGWALPCTQDLWLTLNLVIAKASVRSKCWHRILVLGKQSVKIDLGKETELFFYKLDHSMDLLLFFNKCCCTSASPCFPWRI